MLKTSLRKGLFGSMILCGRLIHSFSIIYIHKIHIIPKLYCRNYVCNTRKTGRSISLSVKYPDWTYILVVFTRKDLFIFAAVVWQHPGFLLFLVWIHRWLRKDAQSLKQHRRSALLFFEFVRQISRSLGAKNRRLFRDFWHRPLRYL